MTGWIRESRGARAAAMLLFACALSLKLILPAGYMPTQSAQGLVIAICDGAGDRTSIVIDIPKEDSGKSEPGHMAQAEPCAFASVSAPVLGADAPAALAKPAQLLAEIALPPPAAIDPADPDYLTPPLRGPPALA